MFTLDSIDRELIAAIGKDARQDSATLAKQMNVSAATVRRRLRRLIQSDVLRIVGAVNAAKVGFPLLVVMAFDVTHEKLDSVLKDLAARPEIRWASPVSGRFDIMAWGRFSSNEQLGIFVTTVLPKIEGVRDWETFICLGSSGFDYPLIRRP